MLANWDEIKRDEKAAHVGLRRRADVASRRSPSPQQLAARRRKVGFDWHDVGGPLAKIAEELDELAEARDADDATAVTDELGDLLFAVVNVARHLGVEPELALRAAAGEVPPSLRGVEALAVAARHRPPGRRPRTLDALWDEVKAQSGR